MTRRPPRPLPPPIARVRLFWTRATAFVRGAQDSWFRACSREDLAQARRLWAAGVRLPDAEEWMVSAAMQRGEEWLEAILGCGASPDLRDTANYRDCPLHRAVRAGDLGAVRVLLAFDARLDVIDGNGCTPLAAALDSSHFGSTPSRLPGRIDAASLLLDAGANPRVSIGWNRERMCPLLAATVISPVAIVRRLLAGGADPAGSSWDGTPVLDASDRVHRSARELAEWLAVMVEAGADPNVVDRAGRTVAYSLVERLQNGRIPASARSDHAPVPGKDGSSCVDWLGALVAAGVDLSIPDALGMTLFHAMASAARPPSVDLIDALVHHAGAALLDARDCHGATALDLIRNRLAQESAGTVLQWNGAIARLEEIHLGLRVEEAIVPPAPRPARHRL